MNLIRKVYAQVDGVASPTIPFTRPGDTQPTAAPRPTDPVISGPTISLTAEKTELLVGERTKVQIIIDTELQPISQYAIQLLYSPEYLRVIDFDVTTETIEVDFRDTFFDPTINEVSQQQGIITISAENPVGSSSITNRVIAEIEIEALRTGFAEISYGEQNTMLLNASSIDILQSKNDVAFVIGGEGMPTNVTTSPPQLTVQPTSSILVPDRTPDTALSDDLKAPIALLLGILLVSTGSYIYKLRGKNAHPKN